MTTYTKRTNAKRAAIKAGVPVDQVEIVVHKSKDGVRFGWKQRDVQLLAGIFPTAPLETVFKVAPKAKQEAEPVKTTVVKQREVRNGVKRPLPGTKGGAVWDWMDVNPKATSKEVREWAQKEGVNLNNASIEFYQHRRFNARPV